MPIHAQPPHGSAFKVGVCSWSLQPAGPHQLVETLSGLDIAACQLALVPIVEEARIWGDAAQILRDSGIEPVSGMLAMVGEDYSTLDSIRRTGGVALHENWDRNLERAKSVAEAAADMRIPLVTLHAGFLPHDRTDRRRQVLIDRLAIIARLFRDRRVHVALETGQESADTLLEFLSLPALAAVGVNFDPANMILYGMGDPVEALQRLAARVDQIHIKDATPSSRTGEWGTETPVGEGAVDWPALFDVVKSLPRPVNLVIEREAGPDRTADIARARDLIERFF